MMDQGQLAVGTRVNDESTAIKCRYNSDDESTAS